MVENAENEVVVINKFNNWLNDWYKITDKDIILVAHVAKFDMSMLMNIQLRSPDAILSKHLRYACSRDAIKICHYSIQSYSLDALAKKYIKGYSGKRIHRAKGDIDLLDQLIHSLPDVDEFYKTIDAIKFL